MSGSPSPSEAGWVQLGPGSGDRVLQTVLCWPGGALCQGWLTGEGGDPAAPDGGPSLNSWALLGPPQAHTCEHV